MNIIGLQNHKYSWVYFHHIEPDDNNEAIKKNLVIKTYNDIQEQRFKTFFEAMTEVYCYLGNVVARFDTLWLKIQEAQGSVSLNERISVKELGIRDSKSGQFIYDDSIPDLNYHRQYFEACLIVCNEVVETNLQDRYEEWKEIEGKNLLPEEQLNQELISEKVLSTAPGGVFNSIIDFMNQVNKIYGYNPSSKSFERKGVQQGQREKLLRKEIDIILSNKSIGYDLYSNHLNLYLGNLEQCKYPSDEDIDKTLFNANGFIRQKKSLI